ncbi:MAG: DUF721 domain-containing protein [Bdellovibrio sp. CG10_big_fil_rev_8_21_14_0_10_47_8]|nr:MAG: DUF721 domain-containing protein [Bdellovibrio sp. CG10_big_fil_rev_8_21_14_0_10_47_8]
MSYHSEKKLKKISSGSEVLQALFENGKSALSVQFIRWKLWKKWPDYVGPSISQVSEPVGYHRGILYIWVKNSTWMQQLVFMREVIKDSINKKLDQPYVREVRLTLDRKSVPGDPIEAQQLKESLVQLMSEDKDL